MGMDAGEGFRHTATIGGAGGNGNTGVNLELKYKRGWTAEQRADADMKVKFLNDSPLTETSTATRSGTSAAARYRKEVGPIPPGKDVDHKQDLQLNGADDIRANGWLLDKSVNRSLGPQIYNQTKSLPLGTRINDVTIKDR
ncbi:hypothetical protein D3C71_1824140 [compost metagenome]